jgi:hypothetical protein
MDLAAAALVLSVAGNVGLGWLLWQARDAAQTWEGLATYWQHLYEQWMAECGPRLD